MQVSRVIGYLAPLLGLLLLGGCAPESGLDGERGRGRFRLLGQELELEYRWVEGKRVVGHDMVLEPEDEVLPGLAGVSGTAQRQSALFAKRASSYLWPRGRVPYTIASSVTSAHRTLIRQAIRRWEEQTVIRFVERDGQSAYVTFTEDPGTTVCRASIGHIAGTRRFVYLRDTRHDTPCNLGVVVHELGHTLGFLHEHQRPGRDSHVKIAPHCIPSGLTDAFDVITSGARTVGPYDIKSTMHYRSTTLTNGCYPILDREGHALLHDWSTLSGGDLRAIRTLYGAPEPMDPQEPPAEPPPARDGGQPEDGVHGGDDGGEASSEDGGAASADAGADAGTAGTDDADAGTGATDDRGWAGSPDAPSTPPATKDLGASGDSGPSDAGNTVPDSSGSATANRPPGGDHPPAAGEEREPHGPGSDLAGGCTVTPSTGHPLSPAGLPLLLALVALLALPRRRG